MAGEFSQPRTAGGAAASKVPSLEIEPIPKTCDKCGRKSVLVLAVVFDPNGRTKFGAFSDFGYSKNEKRYLKQGYLFIRWLVRCELDECRKSRD
jgi:hypothetical protein